MELERDDLREENTTVEDIRETEFETFEDGINESLLMDASMMTVELDTETHRFHDAPPFGVPPADEDNTELSESEISSVAERLDAIAPLAPRDIEKRLLEVGYRGQPLARRAGSVLAYRHLNRLRAQFLDRRRLSDLPERENYLFLGSTGCGKTYLVELLFREVIPVPTLVADMTRFSETGYVGDDVQMLVSHLFELAGQDRAWASCGVICLDEFDKLATSRSATRFDGEGTTKDVSGFGVQRSLLALLSGRFTTFASDFGYSGHGAQMSLPLRNMMFVGCGAFSGLNDVARFSEESSRVGFGQAPSDGVPEDGIAVEIGNSLLENTTAFSKYGMLPELIGRFSRLVAFQPLSNEVLLEILNDTLLNRYRQEFADEGVELVIDESVLSRIVETTRRRETGARGLRASLVPYLEEAAFETFGLKGERQAKLAIRDEQISVETQI